VRVDVVHLTDEEDRGREHEPAEEEQRFADGRVRRAPLPEDPAAAVRAEQRGEQERDPERARHPVPVRGDEQDHAEACDDRAHDRQRLHDPAARFGRRLPDVSRADRGGLLLGHETLRRPGPKLTLEVGDLHALSIASLL
jgi:hypothetical protein